MSGECEGIEYYKNKEGRSLVVHCEPGSAYKGPVLDITTDSGKRIVHFKVDESGTVTLGANCGGVGDPKSGMGFGDPSSEETTDDSDHSRAGDPPTGMGWSSNVKTGA